MAVVTILSTILQLRISNWFRLDVYCSRICYRGISCSKTIAHDILQLCQRRTEPWPSTGNMQRKFSAVRTCGFLDMRQETRRRTDRQTDILACSSQHPAPLTKKYHRRLFYENLLEVNELCVCDSCSFALSQIRLLDGCRAASRSSQASSVCLRNRRRNAVLQPKVTTSAKLQLMSVTV